MEALNFTSRRGSDRLAMLRAFATSETQARTDPLTGLLNRRSLEHRRERSLGVGRDRRRSRRRHGLLRAGDGQRARVHDTLPAENRLL